jgi:hypothetical protein
VTVELRRSPWGWTAYDVETGAAVAHSRERAWLVDYCHAVGLDVT